jgi:hypothetical protein
MNAYMSDPTFAQFGRAYMPYSHPVKSYPPSTRHKLISCLAMATALLINQLRLREHVRLFKPDWQHRGLI